MARLPQPGADTNVWGDILNDYLTVSLNSDGTVKANAVSASALQDNSVSGSKLQDSSVTNDKLSTSNVPVSGQVLSYNGSGLAWANGGAGGDPAMGGDLSGVASNAQIVANAVGPTELATNAVTTVKIADSNVTDAKIASGVSQSKITNLTTDLAGKADETITISAGTGLTGGGDLTANRTLSANFGTTSGTIAQGNDSRITGAEQTANKAAANGYASLNASTLVPVAQLGSGTANNTTYLRGDGTWATVSGGGGVTPINGGGETYFDAGNSGTAATIDLANGNVQKLTLTANCTLTLTSPAAGAMRALTLLVFQDATGSRTMTWPGTVSWGAAGAPVLTLTASRMDIISLFTVDGGTTWYGALGGKGF
ncbi:MAG TPA: hypothetical protein VFZ58_01935 [Candidatus Saccharimonadales bacterium]